MRGGVVEGQPNSVAVTFIRNGERIEGDETTIAALPELHLKLQTVEGELLTSSLKLSETRILFSLGLNTSWAYMWGY
ncbi:hypothetical protein EV1_023280 [Malus domestica]